MVVKFKNLFLVIFVLASSAVFLIGITGAADQTITCDSTSGCTGSTGPLFDESNLAPLDTITQTVTAQNHYPENRDFAVEIASASFSDSTPSLAQVLTVEVVEQESGSTVYGPKTIKEWKNDGYIILSNVPAGGSRKYDFTVDMANVGNEYQSQQLSFDLSLGFEALSASSTTSSSQGNVLGTSSSDDGLIGQVLGLSDTSADKRRFGLVIVGLLLLTVGSIRLLKQFKSSQPTPKAE
jgi:hypothetical protein